MALNVKNVFDIVLIVKKILEIVFILKRGFSYGKFEITYMSLGLK